MLTFPNLQQKQVLNVQEKWGEIQPNLHELAGDMTSKRLPFHFRNEAVTRRGCFLSGRDPWEPNCRVTAGRGKSRFRAVCMENSTIIK